MAANGFEQYMKAYNQYPDLQTIDPRELLQVQPGSFFSTAAEQQQEQPAWDEQSWQAQPSASDPGPSAHELVKRDHWVSTDGAAMHADPLDAFHLTCSSESSLRKHTNSLHASQHRVLSKSPPFKCHCGKQFARLYTLERHVQSAAKGIVPDYPCPECVAYQGNNGFKRKDHLIQHFRFFHKYDDDQLRGLFPGDSFGNNRRIFQICHFETCEYYRGLEFEDMSTAQQKENRPFNKLSEYTMHMKQEHNWSPYPCKVQGCDKVDGKGYFSTSTLEKHYEQKHPGSNRTPQKLQDSVKSVKGRVECRHCKLQLSPVFMKAHVRDECRGKVQCNLCDTVIVSRDRWFHDREYCEGEVACEYCGELMKSRQVFSHHSNKCKGEVACVYCGKLIQQRHYDGHQRKECEREVACEYCGALVKSRHLGGHYRQDCKAMVTCQKCSNTVEKRSIGLSGDCANCRKESWAVV